MKDYLQFVPIIIIIFGSLLKFLPHRPDDRLLVGEGAPGLGSRTDDPETQDLKSIQNDAGVLREGDCVVIPVNTR